MENASENIDEIVAPVEDLVLPPANFQAKTAVNGNADIINSMDVQNMPEINNGQHIMPDQIAVLNRLSQIREYKKQVLVMVDQLKQESENIDKDTLRKLVNAYDNFKEQEDQYVVILQNILAFKQDQCDTAAEENRTPVGNNVQHDHLDANDEDALMVSIKPIPAHNDKHKNSDASSESASGSSFQMPNLSDVKASQQTVEEQSQSLGSKHLELATLKSRLSSITALSEKTAEIELLENELENAESRAKLREIRYKELQDLRTPVFLEAENEEALQKHTLHSENRDSLESFEAVEDPSERPTHSDQPDQIDIKVTLERKYNELMATKKRIAEIQSMMSALERKSTFLEQEKNNEESAEFRMNNDAPVQEPPSDALVINRPDFELERQRLADIKRRMMQLDDDQLIRVATKIPPGGPDPPNNFLVHPIFENEQFQTIRKKDVQPSVNPKNSVTQQLNNVRNLSDFTPCFITKNAKPAVEFDSDCEENNVEFDYNLRAALNAHENDEENDTPTIGYAVNDADELFDDSAPFRPTAIGPVEKNIQKNPRLQSFRRNNDIAMANTNASNQAHYDKPVTSQQENRGRRSFHEEKVQCKGASTNQQIAAALHTQKSSERQFSSHAHSAYDSSNVAHDAPFIGRRRGGVGLQSANRRSINMEDTDDCDLAPPHEFGGSTPALFADPRYDQLARHMDSMRSIFDSLIGQQQQLRQPIKNRRAAQAPPLSVSHRNPMMVTSAPPVYRSIYSDNGLGDESAAVAGLMTSSVRSCRSDNNAALGMSLGLTRPYVDNSSVEGGASAAVAPPTYLLTNRSDYPLSGSERQLALQLIACQQQMLAQQDELQRLRKICDDFTAKQMNPTNALDGRPLSRTSLYHLLAPNPYLSDSYNPQRSANLTRVSNVLPHGLDESVVQRIIGSEKSDRQYANFGSKLSNLSHNERASRVPKSERLTSAPSHRRTAAILRDRSTSSVCLDGKSSAANAAYGHTANSGGLDANEYDEEPFDSLRESIYSEVATLISQNEQRPHYLLELFRELQLLSSDQLRVSGFRAIRDLLNRYLVEEYDNNSIASERTVKVPAGINSANNNSSMTSDDEQISREQQKLINDKILTLIKKQPIENDSLKSAPDSSRRMLHNSAKKKCGRSASVSVRHHAAKAWMTSSAIGISQPKSDVKSTKTKIAFDSTEPFMKINNDLTIFLNETDQSTVCDAGFLNFIKKFALALVLSSNAMPYNAGNAFFHKKLAADLEKRLSGFHGLLLNQCCSALLADIQQIIRDHVTFYDLVQNVDKAIENALIGDVPEKPVSGRVASRSEPPRANIVRSPCEFSEHLAYHEELKKIDSALAFIDDDFHDADKEKDLISHGNCTQHCSNTGPDGAQ